MQVFLNYKKNKITYLNSKLYFTDDNVILKYVHKISKRMGSFCLGKSTKWNEFQNMVWQNSCA